MRKELLKTMKTLLVAVGLCAGASNAWADSGIIYGRAMTADTENGYVAWSSDDVAVSGSDLNKWIGQFTYNETYGLYQSASGGRSSVMTFSHTANALQTFDIVFNNLGNTGNANNYSYLKIGNAIEIQSNQQNQTGAVILNGVSTPISNCNQKDYNRGGDSWTIHIEINTAKNTVTALTILGTLKHYQNNESDSHTRQASYTLSSETSLGNSATYNTVTIGFTRSGGTPSAALTSIRIAEEAQAVTEADYTINYKYNGEVVKTENGKSTVDAVIDATVPFTEAGQKYYAADGATTSITLVDGTNILDVDLRKANEYDYSVSNNFGAVIASGKYIEGEDAINVYWPKYLKDGDKWYECDEASYGVTISGTLVKTVNYTTESDIAFYEDFDDMSHSSNAAASATGTNLSNGNAFGMAASSTLTSKSVVPAGVYTLNIYGVSRRSGNTSIGISLKVGDETTATGKFATWTNANTEAITMTIDNLVIAEDATIVFVESTGYNSVSNLDYYTLTPVAPVSVPVTNGYATYANHDYDLDFSGVSGLTAYTATVSGDMVTFTPAGKVPAGTGVLLKGETANVPVTTGAAAIEGNVLYAPTTDVTGLNFEQDGYYNYILTQPEGKTVGFYRANNNSVAKGKAYLRISQSVGAPQFTFIGLDGESVTTGIETVATDAQMTDRVYNLNGQRVAQPTKGLYIVGGKKAIIK